MKDTTKQLEEKINLLEKKIREKNEEIKKLCSVANCDVLTSLYNRRGFLMEIDKVLEEIANRKERQEKRKIIFEDFALIFIDLDDLKKINDTNGHEVGDQALVKAAQLFKSSVRKFDIVARWGGDEFVIGLLGVDIAMATNIVENIRKKLQLLKAGGQKLSASFGVVDMTEYCSKHDKKCDIEKLIDKADKAMYKAKKELDKNTVVVFNESFYKD
ncbi:MAG: GGDEF domain-containing protein [Candidatus Pacebacteria bacterium]|nr:GGDEF domain-containing protein [Candidatus Paceibacterota bacterium]